MNDRSPVTDRPPGSTFVGRERELAELLANLEDAARGCGRLFLVVGEAGVGKTRLLEEFAREAEGRGGEVLWGRCWEGEGAPPYWPWVQVIRAYLRTADPERLASMRGGASYLARLVPELRQRLPDLPPAPTSPESEYARFYVFDAATTFFRNAAATTPLVVVFDDLQWADTPSLLLLQFLAHEIRDARILLVGAYREAEVRQAPALAEILGALVRDGHHLPLRGLSEEEVGRFIEQTAGRAVAAALVRTVHRETEGNPFFVDEVVRLLAAEGALERFALARSGGFPVPQGVREAIRRRLAPLPAASTQILAVAAVVGREFDLVCLGRACDLRTADVLDALGPPLGRAIILGDASVPGRYRFSHALVREAIYEELAPADRIRLHRRIGEVLEERYQADPEPHLAELAHHFLEAAPGGEVDKGIAYATRAGKRAADSLAYEEAAELYERALRTLQITRAGNETERCALLLALGEVQWRAGDGSSPRETFRQAADLAKRIGEPSLLARSALGLAGEGSGLLWVKSGVVDESLLKLLEDALYAVGDRDLALRARLLACLAVQLYYSPTAERGVSLSEQAVTLAREAGAPRVLAAALRARCVVLWKRENAEERLALATQIVRLGEETGDRELALPGHRFRIIEFLERGDIIAVDREIDAWARIAGELRQPLYLSYLARWRAMRATLDGRFADAEQQAELALELARRAGDEEDALLGFAVQVAVIRIHQGRLEEGARSVALVGSGSRLARCYFAHLHGEQGRVSEARRELAGMMQEEFASQRLRGQLRPYLMCALSSLCATVGDAENAAILYEKLLPHAGRISVLSHAVSCRGSVSHALGELAATLGRTDDAIGHFANALEVHERMGAWPLVAWTQNAYARALLVRDGPGDAERAADLLGRALATARDLGVNGLLARIQLPNGSPEELRTGESDAGSSARGTPPDAAGRREATSQEMVFHNDGEFWTIAYGGAAHHLKDTKGLRHLACLLRHPGREFHALELAAAVDGGTLQVAPAGYRRPFTSQECEGVIAPLGEIRGMLDAKATLAYRARLEELREELEEAETLNDLGRVARARQEQEALRHELTGALGLGGRERRVGSASERARVNLTRTILDAIRRIASKNPPLGAHLRSSIRTGTFFSYTPDPRVPVAWRL